MIVTRPTRTVIRETKHVTTLRCFIFNSVGWEVTDGDLKHRKSFLVLSVQLLYMYPCPVVGGRYTNFMHTFGVSVGVSIDQIQIATCLKEIWSFFFFSYKVHVFWVKWVQRYSYCWKCHAMISGSLGKAIETTSHLTMAILATFVHCCTEWLELCPNESCRNRFLFIVLLPTLVLQNFQMSLWPLKLGWPWPLRCHYRYYQKT